MTRALLYRSFLCFFLAVLVVATPVCAEEKLTGPDGTYDRDTVLAEAESFFGKGSKGLAEIVAKVFESQGKPNAFIRGEEAGGAIGVGVRYGSGTLTRKSGGASRKVYWQSPSVGFDIGGNAAKTFILIYNLEDVEKLFQRFPGVDGSLYLVGGAGVNVNRSGDLTLAPIRVGVGWRAGASIGYLKVTKTKSINPF